MKINVHAGHNPDGKTACGAVGLVKESTEARKIKDALINLLRTQAHTVYDCTVDNGTSQSDVLKKIVAKCNAHSVDLDVSIHLNAASSPTANGVEVLVYSDTSKAKATAKAICDSIANLGFKNRGVKVRKDLYVLKNTKAPALLIECYFCTSPEDVKKANIDTLALAICKGINGQIMPVASNTTHTLKDCLNNVLNHM